MVTESNTVTLKKHLTITHAVALVVGMVVGAGYLIIPGLAYRTAGAVALWAWLANGLVVLPLLVIFARIGAAHPSAEGLSGYFGLAFGTHACHAIQTLVLATFILAMPAIAIVGGQYACFVMSWPAPAMFGVATIFFFAAGAANVQGIVISSRIQNGLAFTLFAILLLVAGASLYYGAHPGLSDPSNALPSLGNLMENGPVLGTVFFAFIGWEMLSFASEEFRNPKRDFPLALFISYVLVMVLYVSVALAIQWNLADTDPLLTSSPISALLQKIFGRGFAVGLGALAVVIVFANINGATLAVSRLVYASARSGLLPRKLATLNPQSQVPSGAIVGITGCFILMVGLVAFGFTSQAFLFRVAGKTFLLVYLLSALAYLKLSKSTLESVLGGGAILICLTVASTYGADVVFPLFVFFTSIVLSAALDYFAGSR